MQGSQSLDIMSFGNFHLDCLVIQIYDKTYDEVVSCSWFHTVISFLTSQPEACSLITLLLFDKLLDEVSYFSCRSAHVYCPSPNSTLWTFTPKLINFVGSDVTDKLHSDSSACSLEQAAADHQPWQRTYNLHGKSKPVSLCTSFLFAHAEIFDVAARKL